MPGRHSEIRPQRRQMLGCALLVCLLVSASNALRGDAAPFASNQAGHTGATVVTRPATGGRTTPVGLPQDAGPHDSDAIIEWWYFNTFLTTANNHHYAVVGAFFRTGVTPKRKGHYLIYSLIDLDNRNDNAYSVLDRAELNLLKLYLGVAASRDTTDPQPLELLGKLQREELPMPHRISGQNAIVKTGKLFSIGLDNNILDQTSADARAWKLNLNGDDWTLDLTFDQKDRPPMLVGGTGKTGLHSPDDMYYLSLTRMAVEGTLTQGGVVDKVTGSGWIDRQWGSSWAAGNTGWDWFGLQLDDGSDLIVYRVRDNQTGKVLRSEATLLTKDGMQSVDPSPVLAEGPVGPGLVVTTQGVATSQVTLSDPAKPSASAASRANLWTDPISNIAFPQVWSIAMPKLDLQLMTTSVFPEQAMPVLGMGDAIWEGAVTVRGSKSGKPISGQGFVELAGYKAGLLAPAGQPGSSHVQEKP